MPISRLSVSTLVVLGVVGVGGAWSAPDAPSASKARPAPAGTPAQPDASLPQLRARLIELRGLQQQSPDDPQIAYGLGALYLEIGDPAAAQEQLERAVRADSPPPDAYLLLGQSWLQQNKLVEIHTNIPADRLPGAAEQAGVAVLQGLAWLGKERPEEARASFKEALALVPDYSPAYAGLARTSLAEGNLAAARDALKSAEQGGQADPAELATLRGDLAASEKDYAAAEAAYGEAARLKPFQLWRLRPLAQVQIEQKKLDAADANLARILAEHPGDLGARLLSGYSAYRRGDNRRAHDTLSPLLDGQVDDPAAVFIVGASSFYLGQDQQARELLGRYLAKRPDDAVAARLLGACLVRLGEPAEALRVLTPLTRLPSPAFEDLTLAGMAAVLADRSQEGLGYLERALGLKPKDQTLSRLIAVARLGSADGEAGAAELEKIVAAGGEGLADLELALLQRHLRAREYAAVLAGALRFQGRYPRRPEGWVYGGVALARTGEPQAARGAFEQALGLSPGNLDAAIGLADTEMAAGNPDAAADALLGALKNAPANPLLLSNLIAAAQASGEPGRAIGWIKPLQAASPESPVLAAALAEAYTKAGQPLAALELLAPLGETDNPSILRAKGFAQLRAGRPAAAVEGFRKIADGTPKSAQAQAELGEALEAAGDLPGALERYNQAAELDPGNVAARVGQAYVALLGLRVPYPPGAFERATGQVTEVVKQFPSAPRVGELAAIAQMAANQPKPAAERLAAIYARSQDANAVLLLSRAHLLAKDRESALAVLRDHLARYPADIQVRWELAIRYRFMDDYAAAAEQLTKVVAQDWGRSDAHLELAWALAKSGRKADAEPHLRVAEQAFPNNGRVKELRGLVRH